MRITSVGGSLPTVSSTFSTPDSRIWHQLIFAGRFLNVDDASYGIRTYTKQKQRVW